MPKPLLSEQTIIFAYFLVIFAAVTLKLKKVGPTFPFNPCPSLPSVAIKRQ